MVGEERCWVVLLKGHPASGKTTVGSVIARRAQACLLDKDDVKGDLLAGALGALEANEIALSILWSLLRKQVALGLACIVVDTNLSSERQFLEAMEAIGGKASVFVVECIAHDERVWRERLERRAGMADKRDAHKPQNWEDLVSLVESYGGSYRYDPLRLGAEYHVRLDTTSAGQSLDRALDEILGIVSVGRGDRGAEAGTSGGPNRGSICSLADLPESLLAPISANLGPRDLASLALTCRQLRLPFGHLCDLSGWFSCKSCGCRVFHRRSVATRSRGLRFGLAGDSGRLLSLREVLAPEGGEGVDTDAEGIPLQRVDTKVLQIIDMYLQQQYSIRYIQYNKIAQLLNSPIVRQLRCAGAGCGLHLGFRFDLSNVDAQELSHLEAVVSHSLNNSSMMEYLVLLRRMAGFCYIADRFVRPSSAMATSPPEGNLSCQRCGSIIASTSDVVQVLSHPRTGSLLPQDLSAGSDGEGLFVSKTSNVKLGEEEGTVGVVPYGLRYRSLRCSGCSEVVGWRYQEGVDLRPSLLAYVGRSSLFTSRVLGQVASGDGYIMYEHFDKIPQSIEQDFKETADEFGVGHLLPTV